MQPLHGIIQAHYQKYRQQGASVFAAVITLLFYLSAWLFLRLESPSWQWIRSKKTECFGYITKMPPRSGNAVRYFFQGTWLLFIKQPYEEKQPNYIMRKLNRYLRYYNFSLNRIPKQVQHTGLNHRVMHAFTNTHISIRRLIFFVIGFVCITLALVCVALPLTPMNQFIFGLILAFVAFSVRKIPGRFPNALLIMLSLTVSCRYLWWRYSMTLNWSEPASLFFGLLLIGAESFAILVLFLGYLQILWPLQRQPTPLPDDSSTWPTVDWMITTYDEDLSVVKPSVYAALGVDWPKDKLNIYLLDDGNRPIFKAFAEEVGIHYIARPTHEDAKAGNINYALKQSKGEFVTIFDCDHIATHSFLTFTMGWFLKDPKMAMLQTPHQFFTADPFERNLKNFRSVPNEGLLFYGLIQDGNDTWNASFFCGSCGILRRTALDDIGGIATETVTEDAHTSLRLQRHGYTSAYIRIPLSAGMATVNLAGHIGQRIRWARGMVQIFRLDNPLLGKGLTLVQRLCYTNSILHFMSGIPRLIFLTAPLAFLLFHAYIIYAPALIILIYAIPHLFHAMITNSNMQGRFRLFFWGEFYETVLASYITWPTISALLSPGKTAFKVTEKGTLIENQHVDWLIARPYLILLGMNIFAALVGFWRIYEGPSNEITTVLINLFWVAYNVVILGGAMAVVIEAKQVRKSYRVDITLPAVVARANGHLYPCTIRDYSDGSVGVEMLEPNLVHEEESVILILKRGTSEYTFPCLVKRSINCAVGMLLKDMTTQKHIEFIQCTFARADAWASWREKFPTIKPLKSIQYIISLGANAYLSMIDYTSPRIRNILLNVKTMTSWIASFIPRNVSKM